MNLPSAKRMISDLNIDRETANKIRAIMQGGREVALQHPRTAAWRNRCYSEPWISKLRMSAIDEVLGTYGVEYIPEGHNAKSPAILYCNTGDTYDETIMLINGRFVIGCWGDIVERGNYD